MKHKSWWLLIVVPILIMVLVPVSIFGAIIIGLGAWKKQQDEAQECGAPVSVSQPVDVSLTRGLTVKGVPMDAEQRRIASAIIGVATKRQDDFPNIALQTKASVIAITAGTVESTLHNLPYGDRDSLGIFQMRPSMGWGSPEQVMNVQYAINKFYDVLLDVPNWKNMPVGKAAQAVERSGYPDAYDLYVAEATKTVAQSKPDISSLLNLSSVFSTVGSTCEEESVHDQKIKVAIDAASSQIGKRTNGTIKSGAELASWAYSRGDIKLPTTALGLATYKGSKKDGVEATWYPAKDVLSGKVTPKAGDIVCYSSVANPTREDCETAGLVESTSSSINGLTVATLNVEGLSHRPRSGPQSGKEVIKRQAALIKRMGFSVVGLQELQSGQRTNLVKALGSGYGIYPSTSNYGRKGMAPGVESVNSIVVDLSQIEVIGDEMSLPMPLYFGGNRKRIPLLKLRHKVSGQEFYVTNTHDPAHPQHARARVTNYKQHAADLDRLSKEGIPVFMTGDFNSSFVVHRSGPNITLGGNRSNLAYCIITGPGSIVNSYDAMQSPTRSGCSTQTSKELKGGEIDHIYVSRGVDVTKWEWIDKKTTESDHKLLWIAVGTPGGSQKPAKVSDLGYYISLNPASGKFERLPVSKAGLTGILRLSISQPEMAVGDGKWVLPFSSGYRLTATFNQAGGMWSANHTGLDFAIASGTPIRAVTSGEIVSTEYTGAYGNKTVIKAADGSETWYCHQSRFALRSGQVAAGTVIGYVGSTGNSTGPHLHLETRSPDGTAVDPMAMLRKHGLKP